MERNNRGSRVSDHKARKFGPKKAEYLQPGLECPGCNQEFKVGDYTTLVPIGPGSDPESRERARNGRAYNAVALEAHWGCVTGEE